MAIGSERNSVPRSTPLGRTVLLTAITAVLYFSIAKGGLALASVHPSASPIWAASGIAIAALMLWGYRVLPGIFFGAFAANVITAGSVATSVAIAAGNSLEALVAVYLINTFSFGRETFATASRVVLFALLVAVGTSISPTIGLISLGLGGYAPWEKFQELWLTWWLGDLAGGIVVAPTILLWARASSSPVMKASRPELAVLAAVTVVVGITAFSPLFNSFFHKAPLAFLAVVPLLWAALRASPRETATVAFTLLAFAVWGAALNGGPFAAPTQNESLLMLVAFAIGTTLPSLTLSADVQVHARNEERLKRDRGELDAKIQERTTNLTFANTQLTAEIERRRRVEAELEQGRLYLLEAQRLAQLGSWSWQAPDGAVTWSEQLFDIYGVKPGEFGGTFDDFMEFVHPDDRVKVRATIVRAYQAGHGFWIEERILPPNGEMRVLRSSAEAIKDSRGVVVEMRGVCQDVTDWHKAQTQLVEAKEQLAHSQKIEALGQLTGGAAHDFNNLLGVVIGSLELLRKRIGEDLRSQRLLANAMAGAKRGAALTQRMLAFGRRQELRPETLDIPKLIHGIEDLVQRSVGPLIRIEQSFPPDLLYARADKSQFELVLINLAVNARDAMPDGGALSFSARGETIEADDKSSGLPPGRYVAISVSDSGEGMDAETLARATEPFFTTKGSGKGTGLGLSMVHGFAEQSGGRLVLSSEMGRGTTATIWLPAVKEAAPVVPTRTGARGAAREKRETLTILVVDDDTLVLEGTAAMVEELGHRVCAANNGREALELFAIHPEIDLVVTDHAMPGMTGDQLALRLRAERPSLPIIIATGYADAPLSTTLPRLQKPYSLEALAAAIDTALHRTEMAAH